MSEKGLEDPTSADLDMDDLGDDEPLPRFDPLELQSGEDEGGEEDEEDH